MVDGLSFGLAGIESGSTEIPFIDWMKMSQPMWMTTAEDGWSQDHAALKATGVLDANGWPTELPPSSTGIRFFFARPEGEVVDMILTYEGAGTLWHGGTEVEPGRVELTLTGGNRWFDITETDPESTGDYIRNIRIFRADQEALLDGGEIFNPEFLAIVEGAQIVRFMNWMETNNSTQEGWADRPLLSHATWASYLGTLNGAPVEVMVALANRIGANPWFCMPHEATDEYVTEFATYVRDNLDPELRAHVEYSNETWNWLFGQTGWLQEQANTVWGIAPGGDAWIQFSAKKSVEFAQLWNAVYGYTGKGNPRLYHVIGVQSGWEGLALTQLAAETWEVEEPGNFLPPNSVMDAIGITSYFGGQHVSDGTLRAELVAYRNSHTYEATADWLTDRLLNRADIDWTVPHLETVYASWRGHADTLSMDLVAYEGGSHEGHSAGISMEPGELEVLTPFYTEYSYSQQITTVYEAVRQVWVQYADGPFMQFVDVAVPGQYGSWGMRRFLSDLSPRSAWGTSVIRKLPPREGYVGVTARAS